MLTPSPVSPLGRVVSVRGSQARVGLLPSPGLTPSHIRATVGQFFGIRAANTIIVAIITEVSRENMDTVDEYMAVASVDLLGEISTGATPRFQRGVTLYPTIGDAVEVLNSQQLRTVYAPSGKAQINVGTLQQDPSIIAYVDVEEMLNKHFAV
ncbi:MAG TPA: ATPase, partial [Afipia sp.]